jgi:Zn-finger protein
LHRRGSRRGEHMRGSRSISIDDIFEKENAKCYGTKFEENNCSTPFVPFYLMFEKEKKKSN